MAAEISVRFDAQEEFSFTVHDRDVAPRAAAGQWLDAQFTALEAEPLRASGKVLVADKVLAVASAAGPRRFRDTDWARQFAANALGALARHPVRVDVEAMTVTF